MTEPAPETKAGYNPLIMERILSHVSPEVLLDARLVCKLWRDEATEAAIRRECLKAKVPLNKGAAAVEEFLKCAGSSTFPTSAFQWDLSKFGKTVPPYPPTRYLRAAMEHSPLKVFEEFSQIKASMQSSLDKIKCLYLTSKDQDDDGLVFFWETMLRENPYVEELHYGIQGRPTLRAQFLKLPSLPNLRKVVVQPAEIGADMSALEKILNGAPNLQVILGCTPRFLRTINRAGKAACVKSLNLAKLDRSNVGVLQFCMASGFKFEELSFGFGKPQHAVTVGQLEDQIQEMQLGAEVAAEIVDEELDLEEVNEWLEAAEAADDDPVVDIDLNLNLMGRLEVNLGKFLLYNRSSLKVLKAPNLHAVNAVVTEDVKCFTALRKLHLYDPKGYDHVNSDAVARAEALLPVGVDPSFMFPNLDTVILELKALVPAYLEKYFPDDDLSPGGMVLPVRSVRTLIIKSRFDRGGIEFLAKKFPNLQHVTVYQVIGSYAHGLTGDIWRLPQGMQSITFHFRLKNINQKIKQLDSLLLGLHRKEYLAMEDAMKKGKLNVEVLKDTRHMRLDRNSIKRFDQLKVFKIIIDPEEDLSPFVKLSSRKVNLSKRLNDQKKKIEKKDRSPGFFLHSNMISTVCALLVTELMKQTHFVVEFDGQSQYADRIMEKLKHLNPYFTFDGVSKNYEYAVD